MTILRNLQTVHAAVVLDTFRGAPNQLGDRIMKLAVAAMEGGIGSEAWKTYMSLFADNAAQLATLRGTDGNTHDYQKQFRAYIVANACCDASTGTETSNRVDDRVDELIASDAPDNPPTIVKPINIPNP